MNLPRIHALPEVAAILLSTAIAASATARSTVVHVQDSSGAAMADAVVLVNPGERHKSLALVTDRGGDVALPATRCEPCVVTAIDPRQLFQSKTTEIEGNPPLVTLVLPVRPIVDRAGDPTAMKTTLEITAPDGKPLRHARVIIRSQVVTMEDNSFTAVTSGRDGLIALMLPPGDYVAASFMKGGFLEATFQVAPDVQERCSEKRTECLLSAARRAAPGKPTLVRLTDPERD